MNTPFRHSKNDRKAYLALAFFVSAIALMASVKVKQQPIAYDFPVVQASPDPNLLSSSAKPDLNIENKGNPPAQKTKENTAIITPPGITPSANSLSSEYKSTTNSESSSPSEDRTSSETKIVETQPYKNYKKYKPNYQKLDVNASDVIDWEALPGIGPYYAKLITNFRNKLGGFTSIEQVGETWRLPDSTFLLIKSRLVLSPVYQKIDINHASEETLKAHPYINWRQAAVLVNYRQEHGPFNSLEELRSVRAFEEPWIEKILPYLTLSLPVPDVTVSDSMVHH